MQLVLLPQYQLPALVERAVQLLRTHEPAGAYYGCFSGGKDSVVIKELARLAGVRVEWHYNVTTIDPPELIRFIRSHHQDVHHEAPPHGNFFHRMLVKGFPTRYGRWCCQEYKESHNPGPGGVAIQGVRGAESPRRARLWRHVTQHSKLKHFILSPIFDWGNEDVWRFIRERSLPYCSLYDEGFTRLGCIGCPMARGRRRVEFERWPRYEALWKRSFQRLFELRREGSARRWPSWEAMWEWWLADDGPLPADEEEDACQLGLDGLAGGNE